MQIIKLSAKDYSLVGKVLTDDDHIMVICDTSLAPFEVTLPDLQSAVNRFFVFHNIPESGNGNQLTVKVVTGQQINNNVFTTTVNVYESETIFSDKLKRWVVEDKNRYQDLYLPITPRTVGAGKPTLRTFDGIIREYTMAVNDTTDVNAVEFVHNWVEGTPIEMHVHWASRVLDATDRYVNWSLDTTWANTYGNDSQTAFPAVSTYTNETLIPANTPDKTHFYTSLGTFTPTDGKIGAYNCLGLKRIAAVGGSAPSNDPWILAVGLHYKNDSTGSFYKGSR